MIHNINNDNDDDDNGGHGSGQHHKYQYWGKIIKVLPNLGFSGKEVQNKVKNFSL